MTLPYVSVVVPVRDDPTGIDALLRRLALQTLPQDRFDVLIADDGSRSGSLAHIPTADGRVRILPGPPRTSYAARNRAAAAARASILAFCDSDCLPEPTWLAEGVAALEGADIVAGEVTYAPPPRPTVWSLLTIDTFLDQERNVRQSRAVTANLFVRRQDFERWGGFDASLPSGGDYDYVARAVERGARLAYAPRAVVRHSTLDDWRSFLGKVWRTNRWSAARRARAGSRPPLQRATRLLPIYGVARARKDSLQSPTHLDHGRLRAAGVVPSWRQHLTALVLHYALVGYVASLGRLYGSIEARRAASAAAFLGDAVEPGCRPGGAQGNAPKSPSGHSTTPSI